MIRMRSRFTFTRSKYIVKYFFFLRVNFRFIVHTWESSRKAIKNLRNCSSNQTTNHRFNPPTDNNAFVNPSYTLIPIQWLFFCSNFRHGRDRMWSYVELSPTYGHVNERLETLRMRTGDHRTDRERTSYPRNHPAPDCVSVSMHFRVFRGHRN